MNLKLFCSWVWRVRVWMVGLGVGLTFGFGASLVGHAAPVQANEKIILAAGCFWGSEEFFRKLPGVMETRVGYAGAVVASGPVTYETVSAGKTGLAEAVEVVFDPRKVSLKELLTQFFKMHDPTTLNRQGNDRGTQYRSAIFADTDAQAKLAHELMKKVEKSGAWKKPLSTEVARVRQFVAAEAEHQKYLVKHPDGYDNHFVRDLHFE